MPWYDSRDHDCSEVQSRLNLATEAACAALRDLEAAGLPIPNEARKFWHEHKVLDAARTELTERARRTAEKRKQALAKLTPEERAILGVK